MRVVWGGNASPPPRASAMNWQEPAGITAPMVRPIPKRFGVDAR
jgi:hypothetical protein